MLNYKPRPGAEGDSRSHLHQHHPKQASPTSKAGDCFRPSRGEAPAKGGSGTPWKRDRLTDEGRPVEAAQIPSAHHGNHPETRHSSVLRFNKTGGSSADDSPLGGVYGRGQ